MAMIWHPLTSFPNPNLYLGAYSGSNPSPSVNGQWWYRVDANQIYMYVNGQAVPLVSYGPLTVVYGSQTLGGSNVYVNQDVIVLPSGTLVTYGSIVFSKNVVVLPGGAWLSSNPNASSTSSATNSYSIIGTAYIQGTYEVAQYNVDELWASSVTCIWCRQEGLGNVVVYGYLYAPNVTLSMSTAFLSPQPSGTVFTNYMVSNGIAWYSISAGSTFAGGYYAGYGGWAFDFPSGTIYVAPGASVTFNTDSIGSGLSATIYVSGTLYLGFHLFYYSSTADSIAASVTWYGGVGSGSFCPASQVVGPGQAVLTSAFVSPPTNTSLSSVAISSATLAPGGNSAAYVVASGNCCLQFALASISVSSPGWYIIEAYDATSGTYYMLGMVYSGTSGAFSFSAFGPNVGMYGGVVIPSSHTVYLRLGANSSGTAVISGTLYA